MIIFNKIITLSSYLATKKLLIVQALTACLFFTTPVIAQAEDAAACPCFSASDIVDRCQVRASNALSQSDRFLTLNCRPPSAPNLVQRYISGDYAVSNGVASDWTCSVYGVPDDGSKWTVEEKHISKDQEKTCRQVIQAALKTLVVKDDPKIVKACAHKCTASVMKTRCRNFQTKMAKEDASMTQSELDEGLAWCDKMTPDTQKCAAECV